MSDRAGHELEGRAEHQAAPPHPALASGAGTGRSRAVKVAAVVAATGVLTALLGFGLSRDPTVIRSALVGRPAPDFTLRTLDGRETVRLSDLRGQVVVVNFFASWCADCRVEHPALAAAWERYRDRGVVFLAVAWEDLPASARAFARDLTIDWPALEDAGSGTGLAYGVYGVPETFFIGRDGRVASKQVGPVTYEVLTDRLEALLDAGRSG